MLYLITPRTISDLEVAVGLLEPQHLLVVAVGIAAALVVRGQLEAVLGQAGERPHHVGAEAGVKVGRTEPPPPRPVARPAGDVAEDLRRRRCGTE